MIVEEAIMPAKPDSKTRAARLRERIAQRKTRKPDAPGSPVPDPGPRPGESPLAYIDRRMRDTIRKKHP
jgi:hypothetical protein